MAEVAQQAHHLFGSVVVGVGVQRQEDGVGAFARRGAQRHAGMHTELSRRIGRASDDLARFGRIAVAADDDRQAGEFGVPAHLDGGLELVEVDVQDPVASCAAELARQRFPRIAEAFQRLTAFGELVVHVVDVEQREQGCGLSVRSPVVPASSSSTRTWRWCSIAGALNRICGSRLASESSA